MIGVLACPKGPVQRQGGRISDWDYCHELAERAVTGDLQNSTIDAEPSANPHRTANATAGQSISKLIVPGGRSAWV